MRFNFFSRRDKKHPSPKRLVVSLCNNRMWREQPKNRVFLVVIDLLDGSVNALRCPHPTLEKNRGVTGLAKNDSELCFIAQGQPHRLVCMDHSLNIKRIVELPELRAIHSLTFRDDKLYAVSTGTDQVVCIDRNTGATEEVWRASDVKRDSIHMNSITTDPATGHLCISAFGPKADTLWSSASDGRALDLETGQVIWSNIYHPHSLTFSGGQRYVCESSHGRVRFGDQAAMDVAGGYVRGLAVDRQRLWVGTSVGRTRSESTGQLILNPRDQGQPFGQCAVHQFALPGTSIPSTAERTWDLSAFGEEIYELVLLP